MSTVYFRFMAHGSDAPPRAPLLEALLARAARSTSFVDWRADALRVIAPGAKDFPSVAAVALQGRSAARWACVATPVHLNAGMSSLSLPPEGLLILDADEATQLAHDFNGTFGGEGVRMRVCAGAVLVCEFDEPLDVKTHDPHALVGRDLFGVQATGPDASRLRRLMSEIELWLFDHPINRARTATGRATLNGLWFWGGSATNAPAPEVHGWTAGRDPLFAAFGAKTEWPSAGEPVAGVIVMSSQPGSSDWPDVEQCWLEPAAAALKSGALSTLDISAAQRRFSIDSGINWRFWRRARPWWESFELTSEVE